MIKYLIWVFALCLLASCSKKVTKISVDQPAVQQVAPDTINLVAEPIDKPEISPPQIAVFDRVIQFDFDKSEIRPDMLPVLKDVARIMSDNPAIKIRITGHTCKIGTFQYNYVLGMQRAAEARGWLVTNGIKYDRIETGSRGELEPIDTIDISKNRRCEINTVFGK